MNETDYLLQDANKRIADLEKDCAIKHDTIMASQKLTAKLQVRIAELEDQLDGAITLLRKLEPVWRKAQ